MSRLAIIGLLVAVSVQPSVADAPAFDAAWLVNCLEAGADKTCIGAAARACIAIEGPTSVGVCLWAENARWVVQAEATKATLHDAQETVVARSRRQGWCEPLPTLYGIAHEFETYRDAICNWCAATWDGVHGGAEHMDCVLDLDARQALMPSRLQGPFGREDRSPRGSMGED